MGLSKRAYVDTNFTTIDVNVFDVNTKEIVFTGSQVGAAKFLGLPYTGLSYYIRTKCRCKKKYAIRYKKND